VDTLGIIFILQKWWACYWIHFRVV